ncbi:MAG TPA: CDP-alcohol phosphatidyltransferase family protein [Candidatus Avipropionibacterium avicola]|uniref:CDP-alcohol phosphatidyltransferase family protein n=1 Tax=Candidatus Avipropionibacterium avicola TaxID=2840701 RepID=A0A9D1GZ10_9ACTN|nr:CDP-alcohol phosphatidyltransferase family protein [Candidatus Avipropionibacterium avicola]
MNRVTSARPTIAELREVSQPPTVRGRKNAEHWSGEYLRHGSLYLTRLLVPTPLRPNGVTVLMMLSGWCIAGSLLVPGIVGPLLALFFSQVQMYLDCVDGELARWRKQFSPAGVYLDRIAHYTTEGFVGLALGLRAAGFIGSDPEPGELWMYAFLGAILMAGIMLNKAVNDLVHVARAFNGMDRLPDTAAAKTVPARTLIGTLRRAARFLPFHRIFHSVELSLVAVGVAVVGLFVGDLTAFRVAVWVLAPVIWVVVAGHLLAVVASPRLRATTERTD